MARILLLLFIGFLLYVLFRGFFRKRVKDDEKPPAQALGEGEDMVQCVRCGVNLPRSESQLQEGRIVCLNNPQCRH